MRAMLSPAKSTWVLVDVHAEVIRSLSGMMAFGSDVDGMAMLTRGMTETAVISNLLLLVGVKMRFPVPVAVTVSVYVPAAVTVRTVVPPRA